MILVYSKDKCIQCKRTKQIFDSNAIPYKEVNTEDNDDLKKYLVSKGVKGMPAVFLGDELLFTGFAIEKIKDLIKRVKEEHNE